MIDNITLKTTNELAGRYYEKYNDEEFMKTHRLRFCALIHGNSILDVGCGTGRDSREFVKLGFDVVGIDVSEDMLMFARKEAPKATFYNVSMEKLKMNDEYNGVWVCSSLYHIPKKEVLSVLKALHTGLKKGGILFITVKEGCGEKYDKRAYFGDLKKYYALYTIPELEIFLSHTGFKLISIEKEYKDQTWINVYAKKS